MNRLVFVYGTLKQGYPNFHINRGTRVPGEFITVQRYPLYVVGASHVPWLLDAPGQGESVHGQIYAVDTATLAAMDVLEDLGRPDGYQRLNIEVRSLAGKGAAAQVVFAYLKAPHLLRPDDIRFGPLAKYTLEHAALYRDD